MSCRYNDLLDAMICHEEGMPHRVHHFLKVHAFSRAIGIAEKLDDRTQEILETAALLHDIGIKPSLEKYGSAAGPHQEAEGPPLAREVLIRFGYAESFMDRVCYLIGRHHTLTHIDGPDYQILIEADFLVNILEDHMDRPAIEIVYQKYFRTEKGREYLRQIYLAPTD